MSKLVSRIGLVSALTMISRILGLGRDMMTSAMLGASVWNSAFVTAFTLPNLFRRMLGEGALTAALMPNLSEELAQRGRAAVHDLVNKTVSWLVLICLAIAAIAFVGFELLKRAPIDEKWALAAELGQILFPYVLLICVAAIWSAALNLFSRFAVPALTAVWLNVSIMAALGIGGWWLGGDLETRTYWLCGGCLLGGFLQMLAPGIALRREGWRPRFDLGLSPRLREVALLTVPGILGAAIFQINVMISRGLAFSVSDAAASLLYYANRLVELPVGVFAVAISTVVFPRLSKALADNRPGDFAETYRSGILLSALMAAPSAVGLCALAPQIVALLFERGLFEASDTAATTPLLWAFAFGMPFYSFAAVETRAFFALKDTRTPVRAAVLAFAVNLALSLALMRPYGAVGLAWASNIAAAVQSLALHLALRRKGMDTSLRPVAGDGARILAGSALMGAGLWGGLLALDALELSRGATNLAAVAALIPLGAAGYFLTLRIFGLNWKRLMKD